MQQYKVVPAISYAWMMLLAANQFTALYNDYTSKLDAMSNGDKSAKPFEVLKHLHGLVSGFKALTTWDAEKYSEIIKQSCGGHGFMYISGLHKIHVDFGFGWQMTEGDNTVMAQQTAKYLLGQIQSGELQLEQYEFSTKDKLSLDQELVLLYEMRFKNEIARAATKLQEGITDFTTTWNENVLTLMVNSTVYFCEYWAVKNFYEVATGKKSLFSRDQPLGKITDRSESMQQLMLMLFRNQACFNIHENTVSFYKNMKEEHRGYFNAGKTDELRQAFKKEQEILAMSLPAIVDGFNFMDEQLMSVLGKKSHASDSEMYEEMLDVVRNNPINKNMVAKGINRYIKPMLQGKM